MESTISEIYIKAEDSLKSQLPFVIYKKPNSKTVQVWLQKSAELFTVQENSNNSGFVFAPFLDELPKVLFPINHVEIFSAATSISAKQNTSKLTVKTITNNKQQHLNLVAKAITAIKHSKATKIVVSRKEVLNVNNVNVIDIFKDLVNAYSNAFVYCWFHPKVGLWLGATPETLVEIKNNKLKTMALAGTQTYNGTLNVNWHPKEIEEQAIVTKYIINQLQHKVNNLNVAKPITIKAGNVIHLKTIIEANINSFSTLKLVSLLHPTPAVCGLPLNEAKAFIKANEGYNRKYYTGYLGELNMEESSKLYVNLRCMEVENTAINIYVGGGITSDSVVANEWFETVAKANTLKQIMAKG